MKRRPGFKRINTPKGPVDFPETMSDIDIEQALGEMFPPTAEQTLPPDRPMPMGEEAGPNLAPKVLPQTQAAYDISPAAGVISDIGEEMGHKGTLGWDEEIGAGIVAATEAAKNWFKGGDFDYMKRYEPLLARQEEYTRSRQERLPWTSATSGLVGSLGAGALLSGGGITTAGRTVPVLSKYAPRLTSAIMSGLEGAGYSAVQAAGEAAPGERLQKAKEAAPAGFASGALTQVASNTLDKISDVIANRAAAKAADMKGIDLKEYAQKFYDIADNAGVRYQPNAAQRLYLNVRAAADQPNRIMRPMTLGLLKDAERFNRNQSVSFKEFHDFQNSINKTIGSLPSTSTDLPTLYAIKDAADNFGTSVRPGDFTGGNAQLAMRLKKTGDQIYGEAKKTLDIERIIEDAQRLGQGKYTQSGFANAVRQGFETYYKQQRKFGFRGWSPSQIKEMSELAAGGSSSNVIRFLAKFDPKGVISAMGNIGAGLGIGGVVGGGTALAGAGPLGLIAGLPALGATWAAGKFAGNYVDRKAFEAADRLRRGIFGPGPTPTFTPPKNIAPLLPVVTDLTEKERQRRKQKSR